MIKKKLRNKTFLEPNESIKSENKAWDKDNQAWWDWYVSLADNLNSNTKDTLIEVPEPQKLKYSSKTDLKRELSRPYSLTINNIKTFQRNGFIKLKNILIISDDDSLKNINKSARNIKDLKLIKQEGTNIYDLFKYKNVIITSTSVKKIQERVLNEKN